MRYDQYQQWRTRVTGLIADKVKELRPTPSNYVTVLDKSIGIDPYVPQPEVPAEPTWEYLLKGSIIADAGELIFPEATAARIGRPSGIIVSDGFFWQSTQLIGWPPGTEDPFNYQKTLTFRMTSSQDYDEQTGLGVYQGGLMVTLGLYNSENGYISGVTPIIREYRIPVRYSFITQTFYPPGLGQYELTPLSVERL